MTFGSMGASAACSGSFGLATDQPRPASARVHAEIDRSTSSSARSCCRRRGVPFGWWLPPAPTSGPGRCRQMNAARSRRAASARRRWAKKAAPRAHHGRRPEAGLRRAADAFWGLDAVAAALVERASAAAAWPRAAPIMALAVDSQMLSSGFFLSQGLLRRVTACLRAVVRHATLRWRSRPS